VRPTIARAVRPALARCGRVTVRAIPRIVACLCVTLSLSKGEPHILAAETQPQLLVATHDLLIYVEGEQRHVAQATGSSHGYKLVGTTSDGSVLIAYVDFGMQRVELLSRDLTTRTVKEFGRVRVPLIGPAGDGFVAFNSAAGLLFRYDLHGSLVGRPISPAGVNAAIGLGDSVVTVGNGRLSVYDDRGRTHRQMLFEGDRLVAMPGERFAVTDTEHSEVRVYTKDLELKSTLRFPNRELLYLAAGPDGGLAVVNGVRPRSCVNSDIEVDVFDDVNAQPTGRTRTNVSSPTAVAIDKNGFYVANFPCRSDEDGTIASFALNGTPRGITRILGTPNGLVPFTRGATAR
jgi:hypothetical protein